MERTKRSTRRPRASLKGRQYHRAWHAANPVKKLLYGARERATRDGLPFSLVESDITIPSHCPVLGVPLERGVGRPQDNSPSLDRLIPHLGYVPGNVAVISNRANLIKNNATALELFAVAKYVAQNAGGIA